MNTSTVTYCPEDNKIRLYVGRVPRDEYLALKAAGFTSTPKQDCDFVATWTPRREDLAREYLEDEEDIGDEDYSPQERSADRAERFSGYRENRLTEATGSADQFEAGPQAFGHQNLARAQRQATRHDRHRTYAVSQWAKAEYWQERTTAVIGHALYKSSASVRRGRILTLEAEQRKQFGEYQEYSRKWCFWSELSTLAGPDTPIIRDHDAGGIDASTTEAGKMAYQLANGHFGICWGNYEHPRTGRKADLYSLLLDPQDPITPNEAAALWLANHNDPTDPENHGRRWLKHYEFRLAYENAMLAGGGGTVTTTEIEPGGWIKPGARDVRFGRAHTNAEGFAQVLRVFKSPATGRVTSVQVNGADPYLNDTKIRPRTINVERLGEDAYRPPTDDERTQFAQTQKTAKAEAKATQPKAIPLINPTDEDAQKLQDLWNARAKSGYDRWQVQNYGKVLSEYVPCEIVRITQATYSAGSGGDNARLQTITVHEDGRRSRSYHDTSKDEQRPAAFKIRKTYASGNVWSNAADRVIILTDKPQKPIPLDWNHVDQAKPATAKTAQPTKTAAAPVAQKLATISGNLFD